jgi:serine/threonine protein kinase
MVLPLQTETQIWELLAQVLPLLQALHEQGQIHGDIKPFGLGKYSSFVSPNLPNLFKEIVLINLSIALEEKKMHLKH